MGYSKPILSQDVWSPSKDRDPPASPKIIKLHYDRARSMCRQSGLTIEDIQSLTPKFWEFHFDLISARDMTAFVIATIHVNLCIGTLSSFAKSRPDLSSLLDDLLNFEVCGEFMLTEIGHGLDARNLETRATLLPDGSFDLHSPSPSAYKAMPPTTPQAGVPRIAVVFARLIVKGHDHGVRPFIVWLNDAENMRRGVTSRALPTRPGTKPLDHAITSFEHVHLPPTALLGSLSKPENPRADFARQIWRVSIGTLALSLMGISSIKVAGKIVGTYSQRRLVTAAAKDGAGVPIISFSTQQRPILRALVGSIILDAFAHWTIKEFMDTRHGLDIRHALATVFKATVVRQTHVLNELSERCGWQGLFAYNQISELALTFQGNVIAEGDTLVLCIRLASELLGGRYHLPAPRDQTTAVARHEIGLYLEGKQKISELGGYQSRHGERFNNHILPRCRPLVEAIGNRMAYEAAEGAGVRPEVLHLFEQLCISEELSWYVEGGLVTRAGSLDSLAEAYSAALPLLQENLRDSATDGYITAPIMTSQLWDEFVQDLQTFQHSSTQPALETDGHVTDSIMTPRVRDSKSFQEPQPSAQLVAGPVGFLSKL